MSLKDALGRRLRGELAIVAIGNPLRGDDAAGTLLVRRLRPAPGVHLIEAEEAPENHLGPIAAARPSTILIVDAVDLGAAPGSVALLVADDLQGYAASTHRVPLGLLMDVLAQQTRADVLLLAIQPGQLLLGGAVSPNVEASVGAVAQTLDDLLEVRRAEPHAPDVPGEATC
jgi:hydrogenase 3 maturation protease